MMNTMRLGLLMGLVACFLLVSGALAAPAPASARRPLYPRCRL